MRERWAFCAGFPGYEVSSLGQVRQRHTGRLVLPFDHHGYRRVNLQRAGVWTKKFVHVLVWTSFRGPIPRGMEIDHRNRRRHVCRLDNLRLATRRQQIGNMRMLGGSSRYRGVTWCKSRSSWQAQIRMDGKNRFLGRYKRAKDAARAYDRVARRYFGTFAVLNFGRK